MAKGPGAGPGREKPPLLRGGWARFSRWGLRPRWPPPPARRLPGEERPGYEAGELPQRVRNRAEAP